MIYKNVLIERGTAIGQLEVAHPVLVTLNYDSSHVIGTAIVTQADNGDLLADIDVDYDANDLYPGIGWVPAGEPEFKGEMMIAKGKLIQIGVFSRNNMDESIPKLGTYLAQSANLAF